ncbi:MAG: hypothetical protein PHN55_03335 [Dysgonamonadaceae bacterium]|nr:hypothetical protein [Dysgonamonadaceae bacterium]
MDEISIFIDEIRTFNIVILQSSFSEESLSLSENNEFKSLGYKSSLPNASINLYIVHRRFEPFLMKFYNKARTSLKFLSKEEIINAATQVLNFYIGDILKKTTFYSREYISNKFDDNQRSELFASLEEFSKEGSIEYNMFTDRPFISHDFFQALIKDLATKNSYSLRLMKDIAKVLKEKIIIEEKENPHIFHIHENTLLELLNEKIGIHDDIEESMPSETGQNKLNVSDSKIESGSERVKNTPSKDNAKKTPQIKTLFNFIDFLHANIDNFNQYENAILELNEMFERFFQLGFHIEEIIERKALQKEIDAKWNIITDNIVTPIKEKVAELNLFDWSAPETLYNNYFIIANRLSKTCKKKDFHAIYYAKRQYIEFTNEISSNVIKEAQSMFEILNKMMFEIAKNFEKKGDKPIKKIEAKQVDDIQKEIERYKSGEIASLPLDITSSDTQSTQFNLYEPNSKTENNLQRIEQVTQDKPEEDIRSHAPEDASKEKESKKVKPFFIPKCILEKLEIQVFIEDANENPITWLKNKQLLRELVMHKNIKKEKCSKADVERATPIYFIYKGQPAKLAKNKNIDTIERDNMLDILSQLDD